MRFRHHSRLVGHRGGVRLGPVAGGAPERQAPAAGRAFPDLYQWLAQIASGWVVVEPCPELKATAVRMLRMHALRAADALQLAAALIACRYDPSSLAFVTRNDRLALAADREGFPLAWKR